MANFSIHDTNEDINDNFNIIANEQMTLNEFNIDSLQQRCDIFKIIEDIFWKLRFNQVTKGTYYLKYAIFFSIL